MRERERHRDCQNREGKIESLYMLKEKMKRGIVGQKHVCKHLSATCLQDTNRRGTKKEGGTEGKGRWEEKERRREEEGGEWDGRETDDQQMECDGRIPRKTQIAGEPSEQLFIKRGRKTEARIDCCS